MYMFVEGIELMPKIMTALYHKPEEYDVIISIYSDEGLLVKEEKLKGIKQVIVKSKEVRVSAQLANNPIVLIIDTDKPVYSVKESKLLIIGE